MTRRIVEWSAMTLAATAILTAVALIGAHRSISLASGSTVTEVLWMIAIVALIAAVLAEPVPSARGAITAVAGAAWCAPIVVGWRDGPDLARSIAVVVAALMVPALVHLATLSSSEDRERRVDSTIRWSAWVLFAAFAIGTALVRDPFLVLDCWNNCTAASFVVMPIPSLAAALGVAASLCTVALALIVWGSIPFGAILPAAGGWVELRHRVPAAVALTVAAAVAIADLSGARLGAPPHPALFSIAAISLTALGVAGTIAGLARRRTRGDVARIADDLESSGTNGGLQRALAARLRDPDLEVLYRLPDSDEYVDADGTRRDIAGHPGQVVTMIRRADDVVAVVRHGSSRIDHEDLESQLGAGARLAIDNERLRAGIRAQLIALRASRERVVTAADEDRQRIERNLHDGAQQSLIVLQYELGLALLETDQPLRAEVERRLTEARTITERLRSLAHGIFPAVLADLGLEEAVVRLAEDASVPIELQVDVPARCAPAVERAAYLVARVAVASAGSAGGGPISIDITGAHGSLRVRARGTGSIDSGSLRDRIDAIGGTIEISDGDVKAVIPCE